jgi:thymidylate synthase
MFFQITADHPNESYKRVLRDVLELGEEVSPRGKLTYELQPAIHHIYSPAKKLCSIPGRKANPFFNMAENLWIIAGRGNAEWVCSFNNKLKEFQLDEGHVDFNAPYGRRIRFANKHREEELTINKINFFNMKKIPQVDQLLHCYLSLKSDPDSRQAVVSLWNPLIDYVVHETKDRPCNTTIYFKIRNGKLNMTVSNRSNDIHLGLYGVNFVQFAHIQEFMAASLNVGIGTYTHLSDSLHVYADSQHTDNINNSKYGFDIYDYVEPKILNYKDFSSDVSNPAPNLNDFLSIADQVIDENLNFRKNGVSQIAGYCKSDYALHCYKYLIAYDYYKAGDYDTAFQLLQIVFDYGFKDWAILGLEFFMRSEKFLNHVNIEKITDFLKQNFEAKAANHILQYVTNH